MKRATTLLLFLLILLTGYTQNPFADYGYKPKMATLSNGRFDEFHDKNQIVEIGSVKFDTQTNKIVGLVESDTLGSAMDVQTVSRFISIDPHAERYYSISPYAYCMGNPVKFIDPNGKDIAILIAKNGAGGHGHMGAVIQRGDGAYFYMTVGTNDPNVVTLKGLSSGVQGGMYLGEIGFGDKEKNMNNAISIIGEIDKQNSRYTDNLIFETSSQMDKEVLQKAATLKSQMDKNDVKYNALSNNCADAVKRVFEKGTGVKLDIGKSPIPNTNFENIKNNQLEIQKKIHEKEKGH